MFHLFLLIYELMPLLIFAIVARKYKCINDIYFTGTSCNYPLYNDGFVSEIVTAMSQFHHIYQFIKNLGIMPHIFCLGRSHFSFLYVGSACMGSFIFCLSFGWKAMVNWLSILFIIL